jgi:hypothetical protein
MLRGFKPLNTRRPETRASRGAIRVSLWVVRPKAGRTLEDAWNKGIDPVEGSDLGMTRSWASAGRSGA